MSCESTNWDSNKKLSEEVKINYLITKRSKIWWRFFLKDWILICTRSYENI